MPKSAFQFLVACILALALAPAPAAAAPTMLAQAAAAAPAAPQNKSEESAAPLEENGLIAQILGQVDRWNDSLETELRQTNRAVLGFPAMLQRFGASFSSESGQTLLIRASLLLVAVFAISLVLEWALRHALAGLRRALIDQANQLEPYLQASASDAHPRRTASGPEEQDSATEQALSDRLAAAQEEKAGEMRPAADGVALVRGQRDGVDQVDAVKVDTDPHAGPPGAAAAGRASAIGGPDRAYSHGMRPGASSDDASGTALWTASTRHWGTLRQLPFAIGVLLLDLLPLALFFFVTAMLLHWLGGGDASLRHMVRSLVGAYVSTRAASAVLRFLVAPSGCGVPILRVSPAIADTLYRWLRRIIITAAFGIGLAGAAEALGAGLEERLAFMKIVSLLVHLFAVILIFQVRRPVGALFAAPAHASGPLAAARNRLAQSWAYFAAILVMGVWVVWALGVQNGFPRLIHFIGVTAGIVIAARIIAILVLGALGRIFHANGEAAAPAAMSDARLRTDRYYLLAQRLVSVVISVCTVIALLQVWNIDVLGWLTERPIGRSLLSAVLTIAIAVFVGIVVWEMANAGVERRLAAWNAQGDTVRAARLRTLLPILRTCLFIVIILVVGLTALNEIGINTTPLLASASIVGVALGFGSQKLVQDFITGIFLLMENAMQVGDWVTVAGVSGTVENLSIRTVRLRAGDGSLHIVPFSSVSTVNNSNRGLGNAVMRVSVSYGADIEQVTSELRQIGADLRADPNFKDNILRDLEIWGVDAVDGSTVTLAGQMRCTDKGRWGVQRELNRRILERFRQLGIQIADPRATVLLPREVTPPVISAVQKPAPARDAHAAPSRSGPGSGR